MSEPEGPGETPPVQPKTCCPIRRKVVVGILSVLPEEACGVPDSELADVVRFDLQSSAGRPVIAFRFCPWCGAPRGPDDELRIVDVHIQMAEAEDEEEGEDEGGAGEGSDDGTGQGEEPEGEDRP